MTATLLMQQVRFLNGLRHHALPEIPFMLLFAVIPIIGFLLPMVGKQIGLVFILATPIMPVMTVTVAIMMSLIISIVVIVTVMMPAMATRQEYTHQHDDHDGFPNDN